MGISVHDNLLVSNGTNADTYGRVKGSIDLEEGRDYATPKKIFWENSKISKLKITLL